MSFVHISNLLCNWGFSVAFNCTSDSKGHITTGILPSNPPSTDKAPTFDTRELGDLDSVAITNLGKDLMTGEGINSFYSGEREVSCFMGERINSIFATLSQESSRIICTYIINVINTKFY